MCCLLFSRLGGWPFEAPNGKYHPDVRGWHWGVRWSSTVSVFVILLWWAAWGACVPLALAASLLLGVNGFFTL